MKQKKLKQKSNLKLQAEQDLKVEYDLKVHELGERHIQLDMVASAIKQLKAEISNLIKERAELEAKTSGN
jgi:hypothetical protein